LLGVRPGVGQAFLEGLRLLAVEIHPLPQPLRREVLQLRVEVVPPRRGGVGGIEGVVVVEILVRQRAGGRGGNGQSQNKKEGDDRFHGAEVSQPSSPKTNAPGGFPPGGAWTVI